MLQFLADENFPGDVVQSIADLGYDIAWIRSDSPGVSDDIVLKKAMEEERILITFDKDFGELAFKQGLPASCGIILFRTPLLSPKYAVEFISKVIRSRDDWRGNLSVVEMNRIRVRPIRKV